uniref:Neurovirulence protein ICP34.5 n=1 Tax=Human herpesvirus 1 TaxID=10298 RepID=A0A0X8E9R9_HHV1|nr:neurovirulence protein ICP34.5 [Human alphaherpesvirus 1]
MCVQRRVVLACLTR